MSHKRRIAGWGGVVLAVVLGLAGCVSFSPQVLYDNAEPTGTDLVRAYAYRSIFHDGAGTEVWGVGDTACKNIQLIRENVQGGDIALKLVWNKSQGCPWVGMGIGWANWAGKDISALASKAAIQFYARVDSAAVLPPSIVLILEDYAGKQAYSAINILGIDGGRITTRWTKVTIPLNSFSLNANGFDASNVKQLMFQLEGSGLLYIDEIEIVPHEAPVQDEAPAVVVAYTAAPVALFRDSLTNAWAMGPRFCSHFQLDSTLGFGGSRKSIRINYDTTGTGCDWREFGFSWTKWLYNDISTIWRTSALEFRLRADAPVPAFSIALEDYTGKATWVPMAPQWISPEAQDGWRLVRIPLRNFNLGPNGPNPARIRQLMFRMTAAVRCNLDEFQLVDFRGNPTQPF